MKEVLFTITENRPLAPQVYALRLCGDTSAITAPGQFLELQLPGFFSNSDNLFGLPVDSDNGGFVYHHFIVTDNNRIRCS